MGETIFKKSGSSPQVRGSQNASSEQFYRVGIIPAGAGLTSIIYYIGGHVRDHPRGCGAHPVYTVGVLVELGSSPRVRGSPELEPRRRKKEGIIPAGAGLTFYHSIIFSGRWDHPRGCGAHHKMGGETMNERGSSPRVRGSLQLMRLCKLVQGIIPAGAGLTRHRAPTCPSPRDHPRGCGAHCASGRAWNANLGSSPRVRGSL